MGTWRGVDLIGRDCRGMDTEAKMERYRDRIMRKWRLWVYKTHESFILKGSRKKFKKAQ